MELVHSTRRTVVRKIAITLLGFGALVGGATACDGGSSGGNNSGDLVGVWRANFSDPLIGAAVVELNLMNDGSFIQQTAYQAGALITIFGKWTTQVNGTQLRLNIERGEPKQTCGPLGCTDILYPNGETHAFSIQGNTLTLRPVLCVPGTGCIEVFNYVRIV